MLSSRAFDPQYIISIKWLELMQLFIPTMVLDAAYEPNQK